MFCRKTRLLSRLSAPSLCLTSPCGELIGPPTAFRRNGPSVPWVSLPGPTGVMTHPGRMMSHQSANPILLLCTGVLLRCTELRLDYTDCSLDVFTCNITKLDQCCVLILRRRKIKPNWDVTWRDLHGWKTQLILTKRIKTGAVFPDFSNFFELF